MALDQYLNEQVALRKESVDRNAVDSTRRAHYYGSLSARRAWIEMTLTVRNVSIDSVALRKESVDRNTSIDNLTQGVFSRSPQGERG